jgi:hypothetical protein
MCKYFEECVVPFFMVDLTTAVSMEAAGVPAALVPTPSNCMAASCQKTRILK